MRIKHIIHSGSYLGSNPGRLAGGWPGLGVLLCLWAVSLASVGRAVSLTWDANGATTPNPVDGSGTWLMANDWWNGSGNVSGIWTASGPDSAVLGAGTSGTYGLNLGGGSLYASNLTFNTSGYTLTNGALSILASGGTTGLAVNSGVNAQVSLLLTNVNGWVTSLAASSSLTLAGSQIQNGAGTILGASPTSSTINLTNSIFNESVSTFDISGVTLNITGNGVCEANNRADVGRTVAATVNVGGGGQFNQNYKLPNDGNSNLQVSRGQVGVLNVLDGGLVSTTNNGVNAGGNISVLPDSSSHATLNVSGGTVNVGTGATGTVGVNNPTLTPIVLLGGNNGSSTTTFSSAASGIVNVSGGTISALGIQFGVAGANYTANPVAQLNVTGGTIYLGASGINWGAGVTGFNSPLVALSGGTLAAMTNWTSAMALTLTGVNGDLTFQSADANSIAQDITLSGVLSGVGGLVKTGGGTLTLNGNNSYSGNTTINVGTLALGGGSINNTAGISIAAGATYDVSAIANYTLGGGTTLSAGGNGTTVGASAATVKGGTTVSLGAQPIILAFSPMAFSGDTTHPSLYISQGTLLLNGNVFTIDNASGTALGAGIYTLIKQATGNITSAGSYSVTVTGARLSGHSIASIQVTGGSVNLVVTATAQATVAFSGGTFTDNSVLAVAGAPDQEIYGVDFGDSSAQTTANGYFFDSHSSPNVSYDMAGNYTAFLTGGGTTGDAAFDAVLNTGRAGGIGTGTLTLSNLVVGVTYQVLFLLADTRATTGGRSFSVVSGSDVSSNQVYAFVGGAPSIGGFVLGTFTANGTTQTFQISPASYGYQLNAILVCSAGYNADWPEVEGIIGQYTGVYTNAPPNYISRMIPDAPLLGNGDVGVAVGGTDVNSQQFCLNKIDFITDGTESCIALGGIDVKRNSNLAWNQTVTASSFINSSQAPQEAVDGNTTTKWCTANGIVEPHWLLVDMGHTNNVSRWVVRHAGGSGETTNYNTRDFKLQASGDGVNFTDVDSVTGNTANVSERNVPAFSARYLRLYITKATQLTNNSNARIYEFEAYADPLTNGSGSYRLEEDLLHAEVRSTLNNGIKMRSWLADTENAFVIELWTDGTNSIPVIVDTWTLSNNAGYPAAAGVTNGILWATRETKQTGVRFISRAAIATKILDAGPVTNSYSGATASAAFTLTPGTTVTLVSCIGGGGQNPTNHLSSAENRAAQMTDAVVSSLQAGHSNWWQNYWLKSYVKLPYPLVEEYYYAALYESGCYARSNSPAGVGPGLYFWVDTDTPWWVNDSHLNYDAEAAFFGVFSANRSEAVLPYANEVIAYEPVGLVAAQHDMGLVTNFLTGKVCNGILYPVGIMPWGYTNNEPYDTQLSDASFAGQPMIWYYYHTMDTNFLATKLYPYAKSIMDFWESYLSDDGTRYYLYDGAHEFAWGLNPGISLGAIRMYANFCLNASATLGVDAGSRAEWQDITNRLSAYPTLPYKGTTIYSDYEGSLGSAPGQNPCNLEFIYAFDGLGLDSSSNALQIARNSITQGQNWNNNNGFCRIYGMAARVGYDATSIITNLINVLSETNHSINLFYLDGVERAGTVGGIDDLLMQSNEGIIKLFPVWPPNMPTHFKRLRARGAFLVDSQWTNGAVQNLSIFSEKGGICKVLNPWPGKTLYVTLNGNLVTATNTNDRYTFSTAVGGTYILSTNQLGLRAVTQPPPPVFTTLSAALTADRQISLGWTNSAPDGSGGVVYWTTNLTPPVTWMLLTNVPAWDGSEWRLTIPVCNESQWFYRLQ